ncbi:hypothetical protein Nepgr_032331 [Nepenthes gracilis]|uniref:Methyltransferase-like protein 2 n=1 Tax=Nepenthes gracilis TaxID=150966 RepID=A0AAD3TK81_NEPGR|nr:hypothetical protein Nepgr_032331 [Nepenthes gracilis]
MAGSEKNNQLSELISSGIYRLDCSNAVFLDPVRILNCNYARFRISSSAYYSRFFDSKSVEEEGNSSISIKSRKRKRKQNKPRILNEKEQVADRRHQEARPLLVKAHEALLEASDLLDVMRDLRTGSGEWECRDLNSRGAKSRFIELGKIWQAPLYEITLKFSKADKETENEGLPIIHDDGQRVVPVFNNIVLNDTKYDLEADFLGAQYIIPRESCFYMSGMGQMDNLIPGDSDCGFNLIVIDPPWENRSAYQKSIYPTLPNRHLLSLPIKQLTHTEGALVALWITNREKLWVFVKNELFPAWGVSYITTFYWLKVKADGSLICDMDHFHHRPYECLLLGYGSGKVIASEQLLVGKPLKGNQVIISIPGAYSRKPPIGELLLDYVPGPRPARCIDLFAREIMAGWTSWGNEPLHFQDLRYFFAK